MTKFQSLAKIGLRIIWAFGFFFTVFALLSELFFNAPHPAAEAFNANMYGTQFDKPNLFIILIVFVLICFGFKKLKYLLIKKPLSSKCLSVLSYSLVFLFCILFLFITNIPQTWDQARLIELAKDPFSEGSYLQEFHYQIPFVCYVQLIYHLIAYNEQLLPFILVGLNIMFILLSVRFLKLIAKMIFPNIKLCYMNIVIIIVSPIISCSAYYIYGIIPFIALVLIAEYFILQLILKLDSLTKSRLIIFSIITIITLTVSYLLKPNAILQITTVSIILILSLFTLKNKRKKIIAVSLVLISLSFLTSLLTHDLVIDLYAKRYGIDLGIQSPLLETLSTGLDPKTHGGYDSRTQSVYYKDSLGVVPPYSKEDIELINEKAGSDIRENINLIFESPATVFKFSQYKFGHLFKLPDFGFLSDLRVRGRDFAPEGDRSNLVNSELIEKPVTSEFLKQLNWKMNYSLTKSFYFGNLYYFIQYFLLFLIVFVLIFAIFGIWKLKNNNSPFSFLPLLGFISGVTFHFFFEGMPTYMLPYFILLLPYSASGLSFVFNEFDFNKVSSKLKLALKGGG